MAAGTDGVFRIVHLSDLHCGDPHFAPNLLDRAIAEINDAGPELVVCTGDLTTFGFRSGHKHVPYAWKLENLFVVNAGTVSSLRLRGNTRPCYNVIEVSGSHVDVWRRHPFHGQEKIIQFSTDTLAYEKYTGRIESQVTSRR